jgi:hypothetical protein
MGIRLFLARLWMRLRRHPCLTKHSWEQIGGRNCGCGADACCSVPVYECVICGTCDYGDNEEADEIRTRCCERDA